MSEAKNVTEFTTTELKALAYDEFVKLEAAKNNLSVINTELSKRLQPSETVSNPA